MAESRFNGRLGQGLKGWGEKMNSNQEEKVEAKLNSNMLPTHKAEHLPLEQMLQSRIPSGSPKEGHTQIVLILSLPNFTDLE